MQTLLPPLIKTEYLSYKVNNNSYPDPNELYPRMFYRKYCPKASYVVSEGGDVDADHQFEDDTCALCGFNEKMPD